MKHKIEKIFKSENIIVILVVAALGLGLSLYLREKAPQSSRVSVNKNQVASSGNIEIDRNLTEEEKILFYHPKKDAPKEEFEKFLAQVHKSAVTGNKIVVKDCIATPTVLHMTFGDSFTVENQGTEDMNFGFGEEKTLIRAGSSVKMVSNYKTGYGIYGYGCGTGRLGRSIGVLFLSQAK